VIVASVLVFASLSTAGGAMADRWGRRAIADGAAGFGAGSLAAALAPSAEALVAARALQRLGAAIVVAVASPWSGCALPSRASGPR
jgi:MFS family permease